MGCFASGACRLWAALWLAVVFSLQAPAIAAAAGDSYVLRYGDALDVLVVGSPDMNVTGQAIRPDGTISLPLVGEVDVAGQTVAELTQALTEAYGLYVSAPRLVIKLAAVRPLKINVVGLVNKPGTYAVPERVSLLEALSMAGGLDRDRADASRVTVIGADGSRRVVDVEAILAGRARDESTVGDGDTIKVAEVLWPDWNRVLPPVASTITIIGSLVVLYLQAR